jgi:hypothetical protein
MHLATFLAHTVIAGILLAGWGFAVVMAAAYVMERRANRRR